MIDIVCYAGGTCGDLICALLDPTDAQVNDTKISLTRDRSRLKKPHEFSNTVEKDLYIQEISKKYQSIPSHDFEYHCGSEFIGITVDDYNMAEQAATRFKNLHRPSVWKEMTHKCGANSIVQYAQNLIDFSNLIRPHAKILMKLEDIFAGHAIDFLLEHKKYISPASVDLYRHWLLAQPKE